MTPQKTDMRFYEHLCILHNIFSREFTYNNFEGLGSAALVVVLEQIASAYTTSSKKGTDEASRRFREFMSKAATSTTRLCDFGKPVRDKGGGVSRVITVDRLIDYLSPVQRRRYSARNNESIKKLVARLQNDVERERIEHGLNGTISGNYGFAHVTLSDGISGMNVDRTLEMLGKPIVGREYWIEVRYPNDFVNSHSLRVPTVLTVGPHGSFRPMRLQADGWGRCVDLNTLADGSPEAVHEPSTIDKRFHLSYLGQTKTREFDRWFDLLKYNRNHR